MVTLIVTLVIWGLVIAIDPRERIRRYRNQGPPAPKYPTFQEIIGDDELATPLSHWIACAEFWELAQLSKHLSDSIPDEYERTA